MEAYPKPRHQYIYNPRYGQRGLLTYAGQAANGATPTGVVGGGFGYGGFGGVGVGMGVGYGVGAYQPAVYNAHLNTTGASGWSSQVDTHYSERAPADTACLASTICRHRAHPQAACSLDPRPHSVLRRRWWTSRTPKDLHQRRQAPDLLVHILRTAICKFLLQLCVLELSVLA